MVLLHLDLVSLYLIPRLFQLAFDRVRPAVLSLGLLQVSQGAVGRLDSLLRTRQS